MLIPINDLLKAVLVFDQERDISVHSHQNKFELFLKTGLQAGTILFISESLGTSLWDIA